MPCPVSVVNKIIDYIRNVLEVPRPEYNGFAACPFVRKERESGKMYIDTFDASTESLISKIQDFIHSGCTSALFAQIDASADTITDQETNTYQSYINTVLCKLGHKQYKCICFNPRDTVSIQGLNVRSQAPYFLISIASRELLEKAHASMLKTDYFDNMTQKYLDFLQVTREDIGK
jgi:hypothetical protein